MFLYVLQLAGGKYYVGKSSVPDERILDHFAGNGSAWTRKYKPIQVLTVRPHTGSGDEDQLTKEIMGIYGIENVRGGSYCTVVLSKEEIHCLLKEIRSSADCCYRCGRIGHFISDCYAKTDIYGTTLTDEIHCQRCGRTGHCSKICHAKTTICDRCGRSGHGVATCYARTHRDGSPFI